MPNVFVLVNLGRNVSEPPLIHGTIFVAPAEPATKFPAKESKATDPFVVGAAPDATGMVRVGPPNVVALFITVVLVAGTAVASPTCDVVFIPKSVT